MDDRVLLQIVKEVCAEEKISMNTYSLGYIIDLEKNGKHKYIVGSKFDINTLATGMIMNDKAATYEILCSHNIMAVEHKMVFNPVTRERYVDDEGVFNEIFNYFNKHNGKIVVKVKDGSEGREVFLCEDVNRLEKKVFEILSKNDDLCLCPFYDVKKEYRTFCIGMECLLTYAKNRPYVIGDGKRNLKELIEEYNGGFLKKYYVDKDFLIENELNMNFVPKNQEIVYLSWKFNLSQGAKPELLDDNDKTKAVQELAKKAASVLNLGFATVDIIETVDGEFLLLEVNSGVSARKFIEYIDGGYDIAKNIYRKAIIKMFE
jgi:Glutathione synthase/Ribosomal protein S6 modification enzyme (glutaminyl transferase)